MYLVAISHNGLVLSWPELSHVAEVSGKQRCCTLNLAVGKKGVLNHDVYVNMYILITLFFLFTSSLCPPSPF